jgi:hypothetical protein
MVKHLSNDNCRLLKRIGGGLVEISLLLPTCVFYCLEDNSSMQ